MSQARRLHNFIYFGSNLQDNLLFLPKLLGEVIAVVIFTDKVLGKTGSANYMNNKTIKYPNDCNSLGDNYYSYGWLVFDLCHVFPTILVIVIKFCVA